MPPTQHQKGADFRALHEGDPFVIPNPWDAGSAKVLAASGFKALASTSSGFAFTLGRPDGAATLDEVVEHAGALDRATSLPVSVDLENGYGPAAAGRRAGHRPRRRGRRRRRLDRGLRRRRGIYPLEARGGAGRGGRRGRARPRLPVHPHRARREPHPRQPRSRRHDRPPAGLRAGRADVLYAPGLRNARGDPGGVRRGLQAGQRARAPRPVAERDRRGGRAARQRRRRPDLGGGRRRWSPRPSRSATTATSRPSPHRLSSASGCRPAVSSA